MTARRPPQRLALRKKVTLAALVCLAGLSAAATRANAFQLITPEEAALPAGPALGLQLRGSPTRRPNVTVIWPPPAAGALRSPLNLKLQFRAFGGAAVHPNPSVV